MLEVKIPDEDNFGQINLSSPQLRIKEQPIIEEEEK